MNAHLPEPLRAALAPFAPRDGRIVTTITWVPVTDEFPDADMTVLASISGGDEPVWPVFTDGKDWYDACSGGLIEGTVTHWAEFPAGVKA